MGWLVFGFALFFCVILCWFCLFAWFGWLVVLFWCGLVLFGLFGWSFCCGLFCFFFCFVRHIGVCFYGVRLLVLDWCCWIVVCKYLLSWCMFLGVLNYSLLYWFETCEYRSFLVFVLEVRASMRPVSCGL